MSRRFVRLLDAVGDVVSLPLLILLVFIIGGLTGVLWYTFPRWIPRRLPRLRWRGWKKPRWGRRAGRAGRARLGWLGWAGLWRGLWASLRAWLRRWFSRRRVADPPPDEQAEPTADELPDLPAAAFSTLADQLAAQGRFAEAVRERLRAMVRTLVDRGVLVHHPGWTVTELAGAAAVARPAVAPPLTEATQIFSTIWYGQRPAGAAHDARMRDLIVSMELAAGDPAAAPAAAVAG